MPSIEPEAEGNLEDFFRGKVTIDNWVMTRRQRIVRNTSFETDSYDVYKPRFSSQSSGCGQQSCDKSFELKLNHSSSIISSPQNDEEEVVHQ